MLVSRFPSRDSDLATHGRRRDSTAIRTDILLAFRIVMSMFCLVVVMPTGPSSTDCNAAIGAYIKKQTNLLMSPKEKEGCDSAYRSTEQSTPLVRAAGSSV